MINHVEKKPVGRIRGSAGQSPHDDESALGRHTPDRGFNQAIDICNAFNSPCHSQIAEEPGDSQQRKKPRLTLRSAGGAGGGHGSSNTQECPNLNRVARRRLINIAHLSIDGRSFVARVSARASSRRCDLRS